MLVDPDPAVGMDDTPEVALVVVVNADESLVEGEWVSFAGGTAAYAADAGYSGDLGLLEGEAAAICCEEVRLMCSCWID